MKKTYIRPQVEVMRVEAQQLLANSYIISTYNEEVGGGGALGREDYFSDGGRISTPNLWDQQW